jgi:hypothetical protein
LVCRGTRYDSDAYAPQDFVLLAGDWCQDYSTILLGYVWQAYDALLTANLPTTIDFEDLERSLTQLLEPRIHRVMTGYETFYVQHGPYERETKMPPPAQPPQYDIAFALYDNERVMWPLEAKTLRTDGTVADYVNDIKEQFLTCRYAPFSSEGAMVGYLLSGDTDKAFNGIAAKVPCQLIHHPQFTQRAHRLSHHRRKVPTGREYPVEFVCHHLIMSFLALRGGRPSRQPGN